MSNRALSPRKNKEGKVIDCTICGIQTTAYVRAHIPRKSSPKSRRYDVCLDCEKSINTYISLWMQERLSVNQVKEFILFMRRI